MTGFVEKGITNATSLLVSQRGATNVFRHMFYTKLDTAITVYLLFYCLELTTIRTTKYSRSTSRSVSDVNA